MKNVMIGKKTAQVALMLVMGSGMLFTTGNVLADGGFYAGGSIGASRVNGSDFDDEDRTLKGFAGGKFNDYIGLELALHDFGKAEEGIFSSELMGASLGVVGYLPLGENFDLFAKAGMLHWKDKVKASGIYSDTLDGEEPFIGVGADIHFTESFALRLEMERYKVELSDDEIGVTIDKSYTVDVASVGALFTF